METKSYEIKGVSPLLLHNVRLADPRDKYTRAIKKISSKRKKTDDDLIEMARLEFEGSMYLDAQGRIVWPAPNWEASIVAGAKRFKRGRSALAGVFVGEDTPLDFDGPKSVGERWADPAYAFTAMVKVQSSRVLRTRPIFRRWSCRLVVTYLPDLVDREEIDQWLVVLGREIAIGDYRPRYGRFEVEPS